MSIGAATVWRVRVAGNDANGAGFDSTISGAATDYSQQDAAQLSVTDAACTTGTSTLTSVTGGFTAAMIGNAVRISAGTHFVTGYYFVTARASTNSVTIDRDPTDGTSATGGTAKVGGAAASVKRVANSLNATGDKVIPGNVVYIRGGGTNRPTSNDYTQTGSLITPDGDDVSGYIKFIGENGRPRLSSDGVMFNAINYNWLENLYITVASGYVAGPSATVRLGSRNTVANCIIDLNGQPELGGILMSDVSNLIRDCEVFSVASPTFSSGAYGIYIGSGEVSRIIGCYVHDCRDTGIRIDFCDSCMVDSCISVNNALYGINVIADTAWGHLVFRCTINGNASDGLRIEKTEQIQRGIFYNNIMSNNGGYGLNATVGSAALNDFLKRMIDYNCYYTNALGNYHNISASAHDLVDTDPQYTNAAAGDYTVGTNLKAKGYPVFIGAQ